MKINVSRQNLYLTLLSIVMLGGILVFAFLVLIPEGKSYREKNILLKKEQRDLEDFKKLHDETFEELKSLQTQNRHIIAAFDNKFDAKRFKKLNEKYFKSLVLEEKSGGLKEDAFAVYEVNTTSSIDSPRAFYNFMENLNKSDWVIALNFPIHFKREENYIVSTFTMKVYKRGK